MEFTTFAPGITRVEALESKHPELKTDVVLLQG